MSVTVAVETREDPDDPRTWLTHTLLYDFSLFDQGSEGDFLLAYHFHPDPELRVALGPHLHIGARPAWAGRTLKKVHLPTGRVSCGAFVRLLIEELEVGRARANWDALLRQSEASFAARGTW
jgi:hypothetical protein